MTAFLLIFVALVALEVHATYFYAVRGEVPERTRKDMLTNAGIMGALGVWALCLLVAG